MNRALKIAAACAGAAGFALSAFAEAPVFAPRFSDGMVLQRGHAIDIGGMADPDISVEVTLGAGKATTRSDSAGRWHVTLPPPSAGGAFTLTAETPTGTTRLSDIRVGDVFLCSGQSNMEYPVYRALNPDQELAGPFSEDLRLLKVPQASSPAPATSLPEGTHWQAASRESVERFSALCYFFGREQQVRTGVPVGLIDASWGGSRIEPWISPAGLRSDPRYTDSLSMLSQYSTDPEAATVHFGEVWEAWWHQNASGYVPWQSGLAASKAVPGALRDWKTFGDPDLESHLGLVWFERTFDMAEDSDTGPASLALGGMDEIDTVWVNGIFAGTTFGWGTPRTYALPADMLKPGKNRITVGVFNGWGPGGMTGPDDALALTLANGDVLPLGGGWAYEKVPTAYGTPPSTPWQSVSGLSGMHHAMLAPLAGLRFAGALWYQGESNTGEADRYEGLLTRLATDLRAQFGAGLPLIVVQLPEFGPQAFNAGDSEWSSLRDAQRRFVVSDPASGLVVALGAGNPWDIHPANKQEVARRAIAAWDVLGTSSPARTGFSPENLKKRGRTLTISLPRTNAKYRVAGTDEPIGFSICSVAGECRFWNAVLSDGELKLKKVPRDTTKVRYCWGDTPTCNLMTPDGGPVTPFELPVP
jgi:sialate O-acetylesterase